ncbi:MAG: (2Fe-2S)-binding protein [Alphaproteobacteria bacterium]|mgnify:CR=1 FL=1|nr:(2Fe-2S)-binding protein [Alphaproteobacteria bacterium]
MIICVCRSLNTAKVAAAISAGARSPAQVHTYHDTTINCGKCCETVCEMIHDKERRTRNASSIKLSSFS